MVRGGRRDGVAHLGPALALSAVGLTAVFAGALAAAGISANVVAGFHHDHVFVHSPLRRSARGALSRSAAAQRARQSAAGTTE